VKRHTTLSAAVVIFVASFASAANWTQVRSPNRDGKSPATGLLQEWPEGRPKLLWSVDGLGEAFASVTVVDGYVHTTGMLEPNMVSYIFCCDPQGNIKWKQPYGPASTGRTRLSRTANSTFGMARLS